MYRRTEKAFSFDGKSLTLAKQIIREGQYHNYKKWEKVHIMLCFEHSEVREDTLKAVELAKDFGLDS